MKTKFHGAMNRAACVAALALASLSPAVAQLSSQYGILDLNANGGINPNTGVAWQVGDQYRLAFHTQGTIDATANDPAVYDAFATAQAQQNVSLASSTSWTAMLYVNTDNTLPQAADVNNPLAGESPVSNPLVRAGTTDQTGGAVVGGAGVPVFAMDGTTCIARNNADIYNSWSNPFDGDAVIRIPAGTGAATQNVHYSPFLDQLGGGDTGDVHGPDVWTGGFGSAVNPAGDTTDEVRTSHGNSNANNAGRIWNRFNRNNVDSKRVYALSEPLNVITGGQQLPFAITDIAYDPDAVPNPTVTLTWPNSGAASYAAYYTTDLIDWGRDLNDSITEADDENLGDTEHITVTFDLGDAGGGAEETLFFRIHEQ